MSFTLSVIASTADAGTITDFRDTIEQDKLGFSYGGFGVLAVNTTSFTFAVTPSCKNDKK